jgi:serine/threonine protein kinase
VSGGVKFGRYRLMNVAGSGGMAVVHRAVVDGTKGFAKPLAVKRIRSEYAKDPSFINMLIAEARLSAFLRHPAIVQIHEFGEVHGEYFLVMEYVDGWDLLALLHGCQRAKQRLPAGIVAYVISEIAGALAYAHALRDDENRPLEIVHRDISPSNIMVTRQGAVKLLDFGVASAAERVRNERTRTGTMKGKIGYLAPEQADGMPIDQRADQFALGVVLWECLTMRRLFKTEADLQTLRLIREANVAPPSMIVPGLDPDIEAIALKMLAREACSRFRSCNDIVAAMAPIVHRHAGDAAALREFLTKVPPVPKPPSRSLSHVEQLRLSDTTPDHNSPAASHSAAADAAPPTLLMRAYTDIRTSLIIPRCSWFRSPTAWVGMAAVAGFASLFALRSGMRFELQPLAAFPAPPTTNVAGRTPLEYRLAAPAEQCELEPTEARLKVTGTVGADVLLDGVRVGKIPFDGAYRIDDAAHKLTIRRRGFAPLNRLIRFNQKALVVDASLRRALPAGSPRSSTTDYALPDDAELANPFAR